GLRRAGAGPLPDHEIFSGLSDLLTAVFPAITAGLEPSGKANATAIFERLLLYTIASAKNPPVSCRGSEVFRRLRPGSARKSPTQLKHGVCLMRGGCPGNCRKRALLDGRQSVSSWQPSLPIMRSLCRRPGRRKRI